MWISKTCVESMNEKELYKRNRKVIFQHNLIELEDVISEYEVHVYNVFILWNHSFPFIPSCTVVTSCPFRKAQPHNTYQHSKYYHKARNSHTKIMPHVILQHTVDYRQRIKFDVTVIFLWWCFMQGNLPWFPFRMVLPRSEVNNFVVIIILLFWFLQCMILFGFDSFYYGNIEYCIDDIDDDDMFL